MWRRRRRDFERAHFISAAGGGLETGFVFPNPPLSPSDPWQNWRPIYPILGPGDYLPDPVGPVEVGPPGNAQQVVGYNERGDPIFSTTVTEVRWPAPGEENIQEVGAGTLGGKLYQNMLTGQYFQTPQGTQETRPETPVGGEGAPGSEGPIFTVNVDEIVPPDIPYEPPTEHPDFGQPSPYEGGWWMSEPPQIPYEPQPGWQPWWQPSGPGEVVYPSDIVWTAEGRPLEPIKDPITGAISWNPIPPIRLPGGMVLEEPPIIPPESPIISTGGGGGGGSRGPTFGWDPPTTPPPPPFKETGGGGGGGKTEPKKEESKEKVQVPIIPIPQQGAPPPGAFAPVVGPQGYQSIFGGPLVSREPQYAPMLNMLLRGIGGR